MAKTQIQNIEQTGSRFDLSSHLVARDLCLKVTQRIASKVGEGLSEKDGQQLIKEEFKKEGVTKFWHPAKFRIGPDTTKTFRAAPDETLRLMPGDLFFLDVGPVIDDHEADYGETFVLQGSTKASRQAQDLLENSLKIWKETAAHWKNHQSTGQQLLQFARAMALEKGYTLNENMSGHRLGDFPHALYYKGGLFSVALTPQPYLWVLEIHIVAPALGRGAFFEDILL